MIKRLTAWPLLGALAALSLGGCAGLQQTRAMQASIATQAAKVAPPPPAKVVTIDNGSWLLGKEVAPTVSESPLLQQQVVYEQPGHAAPPSLSDIGQWIESTFGINVVITPSAQGVASRSEPNAAMVSKLPVAMPAIPVGVPGRTSIIPSPSAYGLMSQDGGLSTASLHGTPLRYTGKLSGFLDLVATRFGIYWKISGGQIEFFRTETKTFSIPALPKVSSMRGGISTGSGLSGGSTSSATPTMTDSTLSGASSSGSSAGGGGSTSMDTQASINYWSAMQKTASAVAGPGAMIVVDPSFGMLTITGTPPQISRVRQWVKQISRELSKQIAIEVHVYNVQTSREDNYGVNLGLAFKSANGHTGISFASAAAPTISSTSNPMTFGASILGGSLQGTSVAVQALSTLGHVSQVVSQSGVTPNGEMLALQAAHVQAYLASSATTLNGTAGSMTTLTPGSVTVGFTGSFLPRMVNGHILLDVNMTLSDLLGIKTFTAGGTSSASNATSIQLPDVQSTTFEQSVSLKPGQTLVLTGYRQQTASVTNNGVGSPDFAALGGGVDGQSGDTILAVVITARLI